VTNILDQLEVLGSILLDDAPKTPGSEEAIRIAANAIQFIQATGRNNEFEEYVQNLSAGAPPVAIGRFATKAEAEAAMNARRWPVRIASVLVGDDYFTAMYVPATQRTHLVRAATLTDYLQAMANERLTPSGLSFATKAEAEAWMHQQPTPPQQVLVDVAGAPYLAAYHYRIDYRVLYALPPPTPPSQEA
jgi:hypothetical protein